jgi:CSLREA domain-containing protein
VPLDGAGGMRRRGALAAILAIFACALAMPVVATAETFIVDSTADQPDLNPGDEICLASGAVCTLRAAIQEANSSVGESDEIEFAENVFNDQAAATILLGSSLPTIVDPVHIEGQCATEAQVIVPCVGIDGPSGGTALNVEGAEEVAIDGVAVTGAKTAIEIQNADLAKVHGSWFGVKLNGSAAGNETAIIVRGGSKKDRVGGEGPDDGNYFAYSTEDAVHIHGASEVRVQGNRFGVEPDGETPASNGKDIEVTSDTSNPAEELKAVGNTIGTRVSAAAAATPACDGGCNLISGSASAGVDLEGDGGDEAPAVRTTISGNHIGLDATGTAAIPNLQGIHVGAAAQTLIGGPKMGSANRINGGAVAVSAGPNAGDLVVRGNLIGLDTTGQATLAPPNVGIAVNSVELGDPQLEALIVDNEIGMEGGRGIVQRGLGGVISGNEVFGAETGIFTTQETQENGNLIQGNYLEALELNAILVENDFNEIRGNEIFGAGAAGVRIQGSAPFGVSGNLVGGDAPNDENVIVGAGGPAIEILDVEATLNEVARNRGSANGGRFIGLVPFAPGEAEGPNEGIQPPAFAGATEGGAGGSAEPGARVRVFGKEVADPGELDSFLGETIAGAGGEWEVVYGTPIGAGEIVAATQTSKAGGTSELSMAVTDGGSGAADGAGGGAGAAAGTDQANLRAGNPRGRSRPETKIVKAPKAVLRSRRAAFRFRSDEPGSSFQCRLDSKPFAACRSPKRYAGLRPGRHVFKVRAIDPAGNVDPSPARKRFTVLR